ncbi:MAG: hypothetical protein WB992_00060 [Bryobacteraceae bacterium]
MTQAELLAFQETLVFTLSEPDRSARAGISRTDLMGISPGMVDLLASLALGKRIEKVTKILRKTCAYLQSDLEELAAPFAARHPPIRPDSFYNACQFYSFLRHRWRVHFPNPSFLPDLAYCELAMIAVERGIRSERLSRLRLGSDELLKIRRHPAAHFHRCEYNIQKLLDGTDPDGSTVPREPVCLILSQPLSETVPKVFQINDQLFALLRSWHAWSVHSSQDLLQEGPQCEFWQKLERLGFIEVVPCV